MASVPPVPILDTSFLNTRTEIIIGGNDISIYAEYDDGSLPNITKVLIVYDLNYYNTITCTDGELMAVFDVSSTNILVNEDGELVIISNNANDYSIDSDGNLIYTF